MRPATSLLKQCLEILKTDDVRTEIKVIFRPVTDLVLNELYPYIYSVVALVTLQFVMLLTILILLVGHKTKGSNMLA